jgi:hypothetical protein
MSEYKESLSSQIRELYGKATYTYVSHLKQYSRIGKLNKRIKYTQIALSAISTAGFINTIFTNQFLITVIGTISSVVLLFITLYYKEFNLSETISSHRNAADELWLIRERMISLLTDKDKLPESEIQSKRDELQTKLAETYTKYPKTDSKSYAEAQKAIQVEEEQYFSDDELDKMLPTHLRNRTNMSTHKEVENNGIHRSQV